MQGRAGLSKSIRSCAAPVWEAVTHALGRLSGRYYFEDFVRVYPDGIAYTRLGMRRQPSRNDLNNFLNHRKFYAFAAQFVRGMTVADIGCGSGYGCALLHAAGAAGVRGADQSRRAVEFARSRYGGLAEFSVQGITRLDQYQDASFDVTVSSEVLEHIKEYAMEDAAIGELRRVTKARGVVIIGTPNSELLGEHGFSFDEIDALMKRHFRRYCVFENALLPGPEEKQCWERRRAAGRTGIIVSQAINFDETVLEAGMQPECKSGVAPGTQVLGHLRIDTRLLHNTHSWIVVAIRDE